MANTLEFLKTQGIVVDYCPVNSQGRVFLAELEKRIDNDTFVKMGIFRMSWPII